MLKFAISSCQFQIMTDGHKGSSDTSWVYLLLQDGMLIKKYCYGRAILGLFVRHERP